MPLLKTIKIVLCQCFHNQNPNPKRAPKTSSHENAVLPFETFRDFLYTVIRDETTFNSTCTHSCFFAASCAYLVVFNNVYLVDIEAYLLRHVLHKLRSFTHTPTLQPRSQAPFPLPPQVVERKILKIPFDYFFNINRILMQML